jgi:hypothetical protein
LGPLVTVCSPSPRLRLSIFLSFLTLFTHPCVLPPGQSPPKTSRCNGSYGLTL